MVCSNETAVSMLERWRGIPAKLLCKFRDKETLWELEGTGSILSVSGQVFALQFASAILSVRFDACEFSVMARRETESVELPLRPGEETVLSKSSELLTVSIDSGRYWLIIADILDLKRHPDRPIW